MSIDVSQIKDAITAKQILEKLALKDQDDTICRYPTCEQSRQTTSGTGRPSSYCNNPEHTALSNHRARQYLRTLSTEQTAEPSTLDSPTINIAQIESLRGSVVASMQQLQGNLERYVSLLSTIADPDLSAAQIQATIDRADARIADMQESLSAERSLRLSADAGRSAAQKEAQAAREAADLAIQQMEEAEKRTQRIQAEAEQHIAEIQKETEQKIAQAQKDAQHAIAIIQQQSAEAIALVQAAETRAQEEARKADLRAHDAEAEARIQIAAAEQLVKESRQALEAERTEVNRLRAELTEMGAQTKADREQSREALEAERTEVNRLRAELAEMSAQVKADREQSREILEAERAEVNHLRAALAEMRAQNEQITRRADQLAAQVDQLRSNAS